LWILLIECNIVCYYSYGPSFGDDISIVGNANTTTGSLSVLGRYYGHPQYAEDTDEAEAFLDEAEALISNWTFESE
jgi:hypothetical protein